MPETTLIAAQPRLTREQLALVPTPLGTATHRPVPHAEVVNALVETLGFRHVSVVNEEYAVDKTGNKMFGVMELDQGMAGARFALGIRNSHDKTFRLAITVGYRVFVCENLAFQGDFSPVLAKHSKHFSLQNALSIGVDNMQRNFKPMVEAVDRWRSMQLSDVSARLVIYRAFIEGELEAPPPGSAGPRPLLQPAARGIRAANDVEPVERIHVRVQGTRSDPAIPGDSPARHVPGAGMTLKFPLGRVVATPGALDALAAAGETPVGFIRRHSAGDWGDLDEDDRHENELSVTQGFRLLSAYELSTGVRIWIITEADRSATTILLPEEY